MRLFCSICKDMYIPSSEVHVTNCGHMYHGSCISTWIKQNRTCPQCRAILSQPFRIYFDVEKGEETDRTILERRVQTLTDRLRETEQRERDLLEENKNFEKIVGDMNETAVSLTQKNNILRAAADTLKEEVIRLTRKGKVVTRLESEVESLKAKVSTLERVETVINGSAEEVNKMVESTPITGQAVRQLCVYVGVLKDQLNKMETKNIRLVKDINDISRALAKEKMKDVSGTEELIRSLRDKNKKLEDDLNSLNVMFNDYKKKYSRKVKSLAPLNNCANQGSSKKNFDLSLDDFLDEENKSAKVVHPVDPDRKIKQWTELICAGPPTNLVFSKTRSFCVALHDKDDKGTTSSASSYSFDGFGGRKKIRLGSPTPVEEFLKLKQKKAKEKRGQGFQKHKKIFEYFERDYEK